MSEWLETTLHVVGAKKMLDSSLEVLGNGASQKGFSLGFSCFGRFLIRKCPSRKTVVKCKFSVCSRNPLVTSCSLDVQNANFLRGPSNPFVVSCSSDVRNCGKTMIFVCRGRLPTPCAHFIHFCARRCSETYILKFWMARRCSETDILILPDEPSRRIRWVDRAKLWRNANFELLELLRALAWP